MACETQSGDCAMYIDDYYATLTEKNSMFVAAARGISGGVVLWKGGRVVENVGGVAMLGGVPVVKGVGVGEKFVGRVRVGCDCVRCRKGWGDCAMYYYDGEAAWTEVGGTGGESEQGGRDEEEKLSRGTEAGLCESMARLRLEEEVDGGASVELQSEEEWHKSDFEFSARKEAAGVGEVERVADVWRKAGGYDARDSVSMNKVRSRTAGRGQREGGGGRVVKLDMRTCSETGKGEAFGRLKGSDGATTVVRHIQAMTK